MSKPVDDLLQSIMDDLIVGKQTQEALEAKILFRLLNYCPPPTEPTAEADTPSNRSH
jgi:hypothetical protein